MKEGPKIDEVSVSAEDASAATAGVVRRRLPRLVLESLAFLRGEIRASELWMVVVATGVGIAAGLATISIGVIAHFLQQILYGLTPGVRLSAIGHMPATRMFALPLGGALLVTATWLWSRGQRGTPVDPVEANALRGGRMSLRDGLFVGLQTIFSNGFGASVGLEAAYAQLGGALASVTGRALNLRRSDLRTFVGAGAGAAIGAAFNAPLTGAFYGFEIIIGSYTIANVAPVVAASLAAVLMTRLAHFEPMVIHVSVTANFDLTDYLLFAGLGLVAALFGIGIMRLVGWIEMASAKLSKAGRPFRPIVGGVLLASLALVAPQSLSSGHGAMKMDLTADVGLAALLFLISTKALASSISLGFGFRGGLFFASLYIGSLLGRIYAVALGHWTDLSLDPLAASLVGMGALAVAVVGGPFTMSFLVLETTGDFGMTVATLTASIVASLIVREFFGYSFSTWRLHLRGETIRSAHDVGWLRTLTAGRMMRADAPSIAAAASLTDFRHRYPLGSTRRVVALDETGRYAGIIATSAAFADSTREGAVAELMTQQSEWLTPEMNIKEIMGVFDRTESDELAVLDANHEVLGLVSEAYATRRYAEELEKNRRDLVGGE